VKGWTAEDRETLRLGVPKTALKTRFHNRTVREVALEVVRIAREGLKARGARDLAGADESGFLNVLQTIADSGRSPAEEKLDLYNGRWNRSVDPVFKEFAY
jgi:glutamate--cysteine ligase